MVLLCESVLPDVLVVPLGGMVGRVAIKKAHRAVVLPDELLKIFVLHHYVLQTPVGLLDEREVSPHIVGLAAVAGEGRGVAVADDLIEPGRFLHIAGGAAPQSVLSLPFGQIHIIPRQRLFDQFEVLTGIKDIPQGVDQLLMPVSDAAIQIGEEAVEVVVDLKIPAGGLVEQHPAAAPEHLDVSLIGQREPSHDLLPQRLFAPHPAHEAVQGLSPPGMRSWAVSNFSNDWFRPRMAAAMPLIRWVMWAMVARTSCSAAA